MICSGNRRAGARLDDWGVPPVEVADEASNVQADTPTDRNDGFLAPGTPHRKSVKTRLRT